MEATELFTDVVVVGAGNAALAAALAACEAGAQVLGEAEDQACGGNEQSWGLSQAHLVDSLSCLQYPPTAGPHFPYAKANPIP